MNFRPPKTGGLLLVFGLGGVSKGRRFRPCRRLAGILAAPETRPRIYKHPFATGKNFISSKSCQKFRFSCSRAWGGRLFGRADGVQRVRLALKCPPCRPARCPPCRAARTRRPARSCRARAAARIWAASCRMPASYFFELARISAKPKVIKPQSYAIRFS